MFTPEMLLLMGEALLETLFMTLVSAALAYVLGLPLGVVLVVTDADGVRPHAALNRVLGLTARNIFLFGLLLSAGLLLQCVWRALLS